MPYVVQKWGAEVPAPLSARSLNWAPVSLQQSMRLNVTSLSDEKGEQEKRKRV